jgi:hypothetical protein
MVGDFHTIAIEERWRGRVRAETFKQAPACVPSGQSVVMTSLPSVPTAKSAKAAVAPSRP